MRRGRQKNNVTVFNNAFVVVKTGENGILSRLAAGIFLILIKRSLSGFREQISKRGNDRIGIRLESVRQSASSASAAANQTNAKDVRTFRMSAARYGKRTNGGSSNSRCFQKITTICHINSFL
jgi:hypothetical protein